MRDLAVAQSEYEAIQKAGAELVAITGDQPGEVKTAADRAGLKFSVLGDPDFAVIDKFQMKHPNGKYTADAVKPAILFISREGKVVHTEQPDTYRRQLTAAQLRAGLALIK